MLDIVEKAVAAEGEYRKQHVFGRKLCREFNGV
jgi:hypothetical protein